MEVYELLKQKFPQLAIDGERNVWIVKPAGSSRGRGICLFKNLVEILDVCKQIET
jgi:tubulin monoglycylase TTLL3/8